jgi:hypothetical protein
MLHPFLSITYITREMATHSCCRARCGKLPCFSLQLYYHSLLPLPPEDCRHYVARLVALADDIGRVGVRSRPPVVECDIDRTFDPERKKLWMHLYNYCGWRVHLEGWANEVYLAVAASTASVRVRHGSSS